MHRPQLDQSNKPECLPVRRDDNGYRGLGGRCISSGRAPWRSLAERGQMAFTSPKPVLRPWASAPGFLTIILTTRVLGQTLGGSPPPPPPPPPMACPSHYTEFVGDCPGRGSVGGYGGMLTHGTGMAQCAAWCDSQSDCNSIEVSPSTLQCNLNSLCTTPTSGQYGDFRYCVKNSVLPPSLSPPQPPAPPPAKCFGEVLTNYQNSGYSGLAPDCTSSGDHWGNISIASAICRACDRVCDGRPLFGMRRILAKIKRVILFYTHNLHSQSFKTCGFLLLIGRNRGCHSINRYQQIPGNGNYMYLLT